MNVNILTPDSVGSTLLQRVLTVQMLISDFDQPVINLHELTNGISPVWNADLQRMVLQKTPNLKENYPQTLPEIIDLLQQHDHYKTSRVAYYHILRRADDIQYQEQFYEYLNQNFFLISGRRKNLLEYGISWCLREIMKKVNVYDHHDKVSSMLTFFKDPITIDVSRMIRHLYHYCSYVRWAETNFDIGSYYYYETHMPNIEQYCLDLPIFSGRRKHTWKESFDISFNDYNRCHRSYSDIGTLALESPNNIKLLTWDDSDSAQPLSEKILSRLPNETQLFVQQHKTNYEATQSKFAELVSLGLLPTGMPIKKFTLAEKKFVVKNFADCVKAYNDWIAKYPDLGEPITDETLSLGHDQENTIWQA